MGVACGAGTHPYTLYSLASIDVAGRSYDILNPKNRGTRQTLSELQRENRELHDRKALLELRQEIRDLK